MAYDVLSLTAGIGDIERFARLFNLNYIADDPLSGLVDGVNQVFHTTYSPILSSGSSEVRTSGSDVVSSGSYSIDHEPGQVRFSPFGPETQPTMSYHIAAYPDRVLRSIAVAAFDEMESRWYRGLYLTTQLSDVSAGLLANEDSSVALVVNSSGSDPSIGDRLFSTSRVQIAFYVKCAQYVFYGTLQGEHALTDLIWTESQGLRVDQSKRVSNLEIVLARLDKDINRAMLNAQQEFHGVTSYGRAYYDPMTREFASHRFWQAQSKAQGWRTSVKFQGAPYT